MRPAAAIQTPIAWIAALLVGLLPGTIAAAHPPTDAAALVRVDGSGTVDCVVVHDTIALLAGKASEPR